MFEEKYTTKVAEIKAKIEKRLQYRRIMRAVENFTIEKDEHENPYIVLIKKCTEVSTIDEKEAELLLHELHKCEKAGMGEFSYWVNRNRIKKKKPKPEIEFPERKPEKQKSYQLQFDYGE